MKFQLYRAASLVRGQARYGMTHAQSPYDSRLMCCGNKLTPTWERIGSAVTVEAIARNPGWYLEQLPLCSTCWQHMQTMWVSPEEQRRFYDGMTQSLLRGYL